VREQALLAHHAEVTVPKGRERDRLRQGSGPSPPIADRVDFSTVDHFLPLARENGARDSVDGAR